MADAYGSGPYERKFMQVQVLSPAPGRVPKWVLDFLCLEKAPRPCGDVILSICRKAGGILPKAPPSFLKVYTFWRYGILPRYAHKKRLSFGKAAFGQDLLCARLWALFYVRALPPLFAPKRCYAVAGEQGLKVV